MDKFIKLVEKAIESTEVVTADNVENIILWPEAHAIIRFVGQGGEYDSIAVESEKHNVYAYWAPGFDPMFLDCDEQDFDKFVAVLED